MSEPLIAGIELGGTKTIALIAQGTEIIDSFRVPSESPKIALGETSAWLSSAFEKYQFEALGIASFGPICLNPNSDKYGFITSTPKPDWSDTNVVGAFKSWFKGPIGFDTDVNGAALAEYKWGASSGCEVSIYLTIGTGIGGGLIANSRPLHGFMHPEMGHIRIRRSRDLEFKGICRFHGDCIEGLASGPAIKARSGRSAETIPPTDQIWDIVCDEISEFLSSLILINSPQKILIGGGVFVKNQWLFPKLHEMTAQKLGNYISGLDKTQLQEVIMPPKLGDKAGPLGAIAIGQLALGL